MTARSFALGFLLMIEGRTQPATTRMERHGEADLIDLAETLVRDSGRELRAIYKSDAAAIEDAQILPISLRQFGDEQPFTFLLEGAPRVVVEAVSQEEADFLVRWQVTQSQWIANGRALNVETFPDFADEMRMLDVRPAGPEQVLEQLKLLVLAAERGDADEEIATARHLLEALEALPPQSPTLRI